MSSGPIAVELKPWWRTAWGCSGIVIVLVCGAAVWLVLRAESEGRKITAEIESHLDALRAAGEPVSTDDLARLFPNPPPEKDAAVILGPFLRRQSWPEDQGLPFVDGDLPRRDVMLSLEMRSAIKSILDQNRAVLDGIAWDQLEGKWIAPNVAPDFDSPLPFGELNDLSRLLLLGAVYAAETEDGARAGQHMSDALSLASTIERGTFLGQLVQRVTQERACRVLERTLNRTDMPDEELAALQAGLQHMAPDGFRDAILITRCFGIWQMEQMRNGAASQLAPGASGNPARDLRNRALFTWKMISGRVYSESDYLHILKVNGEFIDCLKLPVPQRLEALERLESSRAIEPKSIAAQLALPDPQRLIGRARKDVEIIARMEVARTAVAVERWRRAHTNASPVSLEALVPDYLSELPVDPYDGQTVRYQPMLAGFVVYSIGPDLTDNRGREADGAITNGCDMTFTVER